MHRSFSDTLCYQMALAMEWASLKRLMILSDRDVIINHNIRKFRLCVKELHTDNNIKIDSKIERKVFKLKAKYTVRQLYNATDFILTKIQVPSMMQCMPSMCPNFICNLTTPQRPTLSMTGNTAPCCADSERTRSQ